MHKQDNTAASFLLRDNRILVINYLIDVIHSGTNKYVYIMPMATPTFYSYTSQEKLDISVEVHEEGSMTPGAWKLCI